MKIGAKPIGLPSLNKVFSYLLTKTKTQISFALTARLISAFVFATQII